MKEIFFFGGFLSIDSSSTTRGKRKLRLSRRKSVKKLTDRREPGVLRNSEQGGGGGWNGCGR